MIRRVQKGNSETLLNADKANELIDKINAIENMDVQFGNDNGFFLGDQSATLTIQETTSTAQIEAEKLSMWVCHNGEAKQVNFYVESIPT